MTAEIAIANKSAVALAADSKVTIKHGRNAKTYDTVNKVFTLSKSLPVGIMIFGNAEFMGYPWETIIKLYRRDRGEIDKPCVLDWSKDFQDYLKCFGRTEDHHRRENIATICRAWLYQLAEVAQNSAFEAGIQVPSQPYNDLLISNIRQQIEAISAGEPWLAEQQQQDLVSNYGTEIANVATEVFGAEPGNALFATAMEYCTTALVMRVDSPLSSGFVIAGFGHDEFFPTVIEHSTDGYIGPDIKMRVGRPQDVRRSNPAYIGAYAQKDMVQSFMNGFDNGFFNRLTGAIHEMTLDSCLAVLEQYGLDTFKNDVAREQVKLSARGRVEGLLKDLLTQNSEHFSAPIVQMVGLLPKDELAHLAESLVALTSLRRRVSRETETVGGPVDVALISKGDGFVWIKRKHYFKPDINPQFALNYMKR